MPYGHDAVQELLIERARTHSKPGARSDSFKLGLAIEGGGMGGVVTGGMVTAIQHLGLIEAFDGVYGSSAGAINGAYLLSRQTAFGTTIYYENINNRQFIDLRRALYGRPVVSIDFLLDQVMTREKVLDWQAVLDSNVPLKVVATSLTESKAVMFDSFMSREDLFEALRASARIPGLGGPPVLVRDQLCLDATICETIPTRAAATDGCSHILVLRINPPGVELDEPELYKRYVSWRLRSHSQALAQEMLLRPQRYKQHVADLDAAPTVHGEGPFLKSICLPPDTARVKPLERRREHLMRGAASGAQAVIETITGEASKCVEVLHAFRSDGHEVQPFGEREVDHE